MDLDWILLPDQLSNRTNDIVDLEAHPSSNERYNHAAAFFNSPLHGWWFSVAVIVCVEWVDDMSDGSLDPLLRRFVEQEVWETGRRW